MPPTSHHHDGTWGLLEVSEDSLGEQLLPLPPPPPPNTTYAMKAEEESSSSSKVRMAFDDLPIFIRQVYNIDEARGFICMGGNAMVVVVVVVVAVVVVGKADRDG